MEPTTRWLEAACAALEPYQWRRLTPEMVARRVVGAVDAARGSAAGSPAALPAARNDARVADLVAGFADAPWRALSVGALCRHLVDALVEWHDRDHCLDLELAWLLDEGA